MKYCKLELRYLYLTATNNKKNLLLKARWLSSVPKAVKKKITLKHHISLKGVVKAKIAQDNAQISEGGITVKLGQDSIHELIIWKAEPVCRLCNL